MNLAEKKIKSVSKKLIKEEVHFTHLGRKDRIPKSLAESFIKLENDTAHFSEKYLKLAFDYGGRDDLITAFKSIMNSGINPNEISEELISKHLYSKGMPDPDLIIYPGGESRLSGYLTWKSVYSELFFSNVYASDFNEQVLEKATQWYMGCDRRKGGNSKVDDSKFNKL